MEIKGYIAVMVTIVAMAAGLANAEREEKVVDLPELTVRSKDREVLHLLGYVRDYSTMSTTHDTVFMFREKMVDYMISTRHARNFKGWTRPRVLSAKSYYRFSNGNGRDSVSDYYPVHFTWADWISELLLPDMPDSLVAGRSSLIIPGRIKTSQEWQRHGQRVSWRADVLADTLNLRYVPMLRRFINKSIDFYRIDLSCDFGSVYEDTLLAYNLESMAFRIESLGRGRDMRTVFHSAETPYLETRMELYLVDRAYISVKEARKWARHEFSGDELGFCLSDSVPELAPDVQALVAQVNGLDHGTLRVNKALLPHLSIGIDKYHPLTFMDYLKGLIGL